MVASVLVCIIIVVLRSVVEEVKFMNTKTEHDTYARLSSDHNHIDEK